MPLEVLSLDQKSVALTIQGVRNAAVSMTDAGWAAARAAGAVLSTAVRARLIEGDHSLAQLAALDHPYARRHGAIRTDKLGHEGLRVHKRAGKLFDAVKSKAYGANGSNPAYDVFFDTATAPYVRYVIKGTRVMLPRDILAVTQQDPKVRKAMLLTIARVLGAGMRAQAVVVPGPALIPGGSG